VKSEEQENKTSLTILCQSTFQGDIIMPNSREHDHLLNSRFRIEIEGIAAGEFVEVSGLESRTEVIEYADGGDTIMRKRPGRTTYSNIVLTKGALTSHALWEWYKLVTQGKIERKSGSVIVLGDDMSEKYRYNFFEAWPCRWKSLQLDVKSQETLVEEIELAVERVELG
jgi:phage tail-like protein